MKLLLLSILCCTIFGTPEVVKSDSVAFITAQWQVTELEKGAKVMYAQVPMFNSIQSVCVVKYPVRKFRTEILNRPGKIAGTASDVGEEIGAVFMLNAGYFNVRQRITSVHLMKRGQLLGYTAPNELGRVDALLGFKDRKGRKVMIEQVKDTARYVEVAEAWRESIASGPLLMVDGKIQVPVRMIEEYPYDEFYDKRHPRTAFGVDDKGYAYMVVIDGRFKGQADGASVYETAYICCLLGMTDAINLDGGGSSTLWTRQTGVINHPSDNRQFDHSGERVIPTFIAVY
jgi:exopolysaccharide biosynthesis protein